ncbi:MAG TPA: hypothetical protein VGK00_10000 [Anaerolineales bacterium]|jgi:hypothetical protein
MIVQKKTNLEGEKHQLAEAGFQARQHVPFHNSSNFNGRVELYKLRGRIGEELAQNNLGGKNLNDLTGKSNFANYDITSKDNLSSVKVQGLRENGEPRYSDYNKYFKDIVNSNSPANQRAATDMLLAIHDNHQITKYLPDNISTAVSQNDMAKALSEKSILQIPYDQVDKTRENIYKKIIESPEEYGLKSEFSQANIEFNARNLVNDRIKSITEAQYSAHDIGKMSAKIFAQTNPEQKFDEDKLDIKPSGISSEKVQTLAKKDISSEEDENKYYYQNYGF